MGALFLLFIAGKGPPVESMPGWYWLVFAAVGSGSAMVGAWQQQRAMKARK